MGTAASVPGSNKPIHQQSRTRPTPSAPQANGGNFANDQGGIGGKSSSLTAPLDEAKHILEELKSKHGGTEESKMAYASGKSYIKELEVYLSKTPGYNNTQQGQNFLAKLPKTIAGLFGGLGNNKTGAPKEDAKDPVSKGDTGAHGKAVGTTEHKPSSTALKNAALARLDSLLDSSPLSQETRALWKNHLKELQDYLSQNPGYADTQQGQKLLADTAKSINDLLKNNGGVNEAVEKPDEGGNRRERRETNDSDNPPKTLSQNCVPTPALIEGDKLHGNEGNNATRKNDQKQAVNEPGGGGGGKTEAFSQKDGAFNHAGMGKNKPPGPQSAQSAQQFTQPAQQSKTGGTGYPELDAVNAKVDGANDFSGIPANVMEQQNAALAKANEERHQYGAPPLRLDANLIKQAMYRAQYMHDYRDFSHDKWREGPHGDQVRYENIQHGAESLVSAVAKLNVHPGHHENTINKENTRVGFGMYGNYGTFRDWDPVTHIPPIYYAEVFA